MTEIRFELTHFLASYVTLATIGSKCDRITPFILDESNNYLNWCERNFEKYKTIQGHEVNT